MQTFLLFAYIAVVLVSVQLGSFRNVQCGLSDTCVPVQYCFDAHSDAVWSQAFGDAASLGLAAFLMVCFSAFLADLPDVASMLPFCWPAEPQLLISVDPCHFAGDRLQ